MDNKLSPREIQVLKMIWDGVDHDEMPKLLGISPRTVETHRARIIAKLGITKTAGGRSAVLVRTLRRGLEMGILQAPAQVTP